MNTAKRTENVSRLVAEFVDECVVPAGVRYGRGEPVRPIRIDCFADVGSMPDGLKDFTVLLHDGKVVAVRGHELRLMPATGANESYGVVGRAKDREELIALFRTSEVDGIFHGELRVDRTIA
jgi:hypothetical protein